MKKKSSILQDSIVLVVNKSNKSQKNIDYLILLLTNDLLNIDNIWLNENILDDVDLLIELLYKNDILKKWV
ncbi:MAG: hypothetical protein VXZ78_06660 [Pseudomonadota bacterium]|nr:hypothetical protein [Pseudomonadota bacterium]